MTERWVHSWASVPQLATPGNLPPEVFLDENWVLADSTVRQTIRTSVGGPRMRLRLSNAYGGQPLAVTGVTVALPADGQAGASAIQPDTARPVTFDGAASVNVPAGAQVVSDPVDGDVAPRVNLTVTMYLAEGQAAGCVTAHPGSRTTSYLAAGDHLWAVDVPAAIAVDHWYFLSGLEVFADAAAAVMLGDSLTDGRGSTTNANDRWPDRLLDRLHTDHLTTDVAIVNQGVGGNRLLTDGLGPNGLSRVERDVLRLSGVAWLLVFEGTNDIGTAAATAPAQTRVAADLLAAYDEIVERAHASGVQVYGATLTPFGDSYYDDPDGRREASRQRVNAWIRTSGRFDATVDFDLAARDPSDTLRLRPDLDTGDHLHLNPAGYQVLADAVPADLFADRRLPPTSAPVAAAGSRP